MTIVTEPASSKTVVKSIQRLLESGQATSG